MPADNHLKVNVEATAKATTTTSPKRSSPDAQRHHGLHLAPRSPEKERPGFSTKELYDGLRSRDPTSKWQAGDYVFAKVSPTETLAGHIQKVIAPYVYMIVFDDATVVDEVLESDIDANRRPVEDSDTDYEAGRSTPQLASVNYPSPEVADEENDQTLLDTVMQGPNLEILRPQSDCGPQPALSSRVSFTSSLLYPSGDESSSLEMPMAEILVFDLAKKQQERLRKVHERLQEVKERLRVLYKPLVTASNALVRGAIVMVTTAPCFFGRLESINAESNTCQICTIAATDHEVCIDVGLHEIRVVNAAHELVSQHQELSKQVDCFYPGARVLMMQGDTNHLQAAVVVRRLSPTHCELYHEKSKVAVLNAHIHQLVAVSSEKDSAHEVQLQPLLKVIVGSLEFTIHEQVTVQDVEAGSAAHGVITEICSLQSVVVEFESGEVSTGVPTSSLRKYSRNRDPTQYFGSINLSSTFGLDSNDAQEVDQWVVANHPMSNLPERCRIVAVNGHYYDLQFADGATIAHIHRKQVKSNTVSSVSSKPEAFELHAYVLATSPRFQRYCTGQIARVEATNPVSYTVVFDYGETLTGVPHEHVQRLENTKVLTPRKRITHIWRSVNGLDAVEDTTTSYACHGDLMLHKMLCGAKKKDVAPVQVGDAVLATFHNSHKYFLGVVREVSLEGDGTADIQFASTLDVPNVPLRKVLPINQPPPRAFQADGKPPLTKGNSSDAAARRILAALFTQSSSLGGTMEEAPREGKLRHNSVPLLDSSGNSKASTTRQSVAGGSFCGHRSSFASSRVASHRPSVATIEDEEEERQRLAVALAQVTQVTDGFCAGQAVSLVNDGAYHGHVQSIDALHVYTVVLDDATILEGVAGGDLEARPLPIYNDDSPFDPDDGLEYTLWWLPRIQAYPSEDRSTSCCGTELSAIERANGADTAAATAPPDLVQHIEKLQVHLATRRETKPPPMEIAVGADVLVRGPPAYFGCIHVVHEGGLLVDILDGQHHVHTQVATRLVEIIDINAQLEAHHKYLTTKLNEPPSPPYPVVTAQTQITDGDATFTIHARVLLRETMSTGLIVAINSNNTVAVELDTGDTDGCVTYGFDTVVASDEPLETYVTTSSISKAFNLSATSSAHASQHEGVWTSLPPLTGARRGSQSHMKVTFEANDLVLAFSPRWQQCCTGTVLDAQGGIATVVFDYGETVKDIPFTKIYDICYTKVVCDSRGHRLASAWNYSHGWEGVQDTSVACKGEVFLHQMLCVQAQVQAWQAQYHVGDVVLARYWGSPVYYRGIIVKIREDLTVNVMFESGHLQRNVPRSHLLPTTKEPIRIMDKSPDPGPTATTVAQATKHKPTPPPRMAKRTIIRRITHLLGFQKQK
ncbi:hypothetical protein ACHHYP_13336 [Achlya hypogyna]|uniref:Uncharacterized protein n=1 Tax=Achlya hypogyna TaxID=1202772 RepID=A0A1V9YFE5_ACHHY|nr:hypothetical protein ACHHYP_13336 [Achlya hypogyna]